MIDLAPDALRGSYPPLVTPLRDGEVDYQAYAQLIETQIREGSHGVVVNGTTGEPTTLTLRERTLLVAAAVKTAAAEEAGAQAALVVTPYFVKPPARGLVEYYVEVGRRTRLPVLIYHIPGRAAVEVKPETVAQIAERLPNLVGIKHAANDLGFVTAVLRRLGPAFRIFVGLEDLSFPMLAIGASGLMNAVGNIAPRRVAELYRAQASGDPATARRLHDELFELNQAVFFDTNPIAIKYMMKRMGLLPTEEHRLPMVPATPELAERLDGVLRRASLLPAAGGVRAS